jgi:perosamine synthetase
VSTRFRHVAPAGAPIHAHDLVSAAGAMLKGDASQALGRAVAGRFGMAHGMATSTGRAGMTLLLMALRQLAAAHRTEIVLPSYTCYSLAASTMKAGLRPRIVDISPRTLDFVKDRLERTDCSRALAIVATNLYGLPNDLPWISAFARERGIFLIDDAAQSMGARVHGRWSGTWGDAGLFSFDKGKPVSAIDGGVIVTNSDSIAAAVEAEHQRLRPPPLSESASNLAKVVAYASLLRPSLYWIPQRIPQLGLGQTVYATDFPIARSDRFLAALGAAVMDHLDDYTHRRAANARALLAPLKTLPHVSPIAPISDVDPTYLRLPVLIDSPRLRQNALESLRQAGIGATGSYPTSLVDIPELHDALRHQDGEARGGRYVADRILTLPTHPFVSASDIARMTEVLRGVLASATTHDVTPPGGEARLVCAE